MALVHRIPISGPGIEGTQKFQCDAGVRRERVEIKLIEGKVHSEVVDHSSSIAVRFERNKITTERKEKKNRILGVAVPSSQPSTKQSGSWQAMSYFLGPVVFIPRDN